MKMVMMVILMIFEMGDPGQPQDWQLVGNPDPLCTYIYVLDMRMI